jgi:HEXXH motif-containing protein
VTGPVLELAGPQIDEIASGTPGADTLGLLRTGQATLRRVLLLAVRRRLGEPAAEAFELLGRAAAAAREPVEEIITRPFAHAWAMHRLADDPATAMSELAALATAAAVRAGLDLETAVPATGAELFLPGAGLLDRLHCATVTVRHRGGDLMFGCPHPGAPAPRWQPARTIALSDEWTIDLEDQEPRRVILGPPRALAPAALRDADTLLRRAWSVVQHDHDEYASVLRSLLRSVAPLAGDGSNATSSSSPLAGGCVAMDLAVSPEIAAQLLIHEVQHTLLAAATDLVPFCTGPAREQYRAPWKPRPRAAPALLQGVFAHASVIDYWATRWRAEPDDREALWQFAYLREVTTPAIGALRSSAELTAAGRRLVDGLLARAARWAAVVVPEAVAGLARRTGRAEAVRWRLGNLRVAPEEAERLADAYAKKRECATLPAPDLGPDGPAGPPRTGGLIARLHAAGLGQEPATAAGPDPARARLAVTGRPADDEAWIALAAVDPTPLLAERPELVRAVLLALHARNDSGIPAPDELATWLSVGWCPANVSVW